MPDAIGVKTHMGAAMESTWGTAIVATDRIPLISEGIEFDYTDKLHDYLHGSAAALNQTLVFKGATGSVESEVVYSKKNGSEFVSSDLFIAAGMGVIEGSTEQQLTFENDLSKFFTIAWDKDVHATKPWEAVGCMVNSFTLKCDEKESLKLTTDLAIHILRITGGVNVVNDLIASGLADDDAQPVVLRDFVFSIGDQGGALGSGDDWGISGFSITVNNNLSAQEQSTKDTDNAYPNFTHADPYFAMKPSRNGFREVMLEITIPRYGSDQFITWHNDRTDLQASFIGTDPNNSHEFDIIFPRLKVENVSAPIAGPGMVVMTVTLRALLWNSASDMTFSDSGSVAGNTEAGSEMWIELDNERTAAIF